MPPKALKLLLTGDPGCGKTTLIRRVVKRLEGKVSMRGFVTDELRIDRRREGFQGETLDGQTFTLATRSGESEIAVGPYRVRLDGLESIGVPALVPRDDTGLLVLDEIGKMEAFSERFRNQVETLLASDIPLLATVAVHGVGFVKRVRQDPRATLVRMRRQGRDGMVEQIVRQLRKAGVGAPPARSTSNRTGCES